MSESPSLPATDDDSPRFKKKQTRVQVALAKYHGMGDEPPWTIQEIADYLRVDPSTVSDYVNNTDMAEQVEDQLAEAQARTRMRLAMKLMDYLDKLEEMEDTMGEEKRPAVVSHKYEEVEGEVTMQRDGMTVVDDKNVDFEVPVPDHFKEVPKISNLKDIWREKRQVIQQIEDLLGLEAPEQVESKHEEVNTEIKIWGGMEDASFPEQRVIEGGEPSQIEEERLDSDSVEELPSDLDGEE
jgi:DNA-binding MarR family transcriptional regulator